jgi:Tfp pilus assembly protein PilO
LGFAVIYPTINSLPVIKNELQNKEELNQKLQEKLSNLNKLVDYKSVVDEDSSLMNGVLASESQVPELLTQINMIATESGMEVTRLTYSLGSSNDVEEELYDQVTVSLGARGSFSQLVSFMTSIENAARLIDVTNVRYGTNDSEDTNILELAFTLKSPYLFVQSSAVTDDSLTLDITDPAFVAMINKIRGLKFYRISADDVNTAIVEEAKESTPSEEETPTVEE